MVNLQVKESATAVPHTSFMYKHIYKLFLERSIAHGLQSFLQLEIYSNIETLSFPPSVPREKFELPNF